jgi:signal transduction histidine kinase
MIRQLSRARTPSQIGLLVNKIAHDLRGPLGAISGFIKILQSENQLSSESHEDCDVMVGEIKRISRLIDRLMEYTQPGPTSSQILSPIEVVETVLSVFSFYPGAREVVIDRRFPKQNDLRIYAHKEELQQAYFNILKNGIEAISLNTGLRRMEIVIQRSGDHVQIGIHDNGPGIPHDLLGKLGIDIVSTKPDGAGAGLIIVNEILGAHGGNLKIENRPEGGVSVTTTLPLHPVYSARGKKQPLKANVIS